MCFDYTVSVENKLKDNNNWKKTKVLFKKQKRNKCKEVEDK